LTTPRQVAEEVDPLRILQDYYDYDFENDVQVAEEVDPLRILQDCSFQADSTEWGIIPPLKGETSQTSALSNSQREAGSDGRG